MPIFDWPTNGDVNNKMKAVIKSYLKYSLLISLVIIIGMKVIDKMNIDFFRENYPLIFSAFFFSFGTLGFLVNVTTWDGNSPPEKTSKFILVICYCLGTFFTIYSMK